MLLRIGLTSFISGKDDLQCVGEADNGRTAVELTHKLKPDVVIMDLMMPERSIDKVPADSVNPHLRPWRIPPAARGSLVLIGTLSPGCRLSLLSSACCHLFPISSLSHFPIFILPHYIRPSVVWLWFGLWLRFGFGLVLVAQ